MLNSLISSLFISLPLILCMSAYFHFDKNYLLTEKISSKIRVDKKWQPALVFCCSCVIFLILGIAGIYFIDIPVKLFFLISGVLFGTSLGFALQIQNQMKRK